MTSRPSQSSVTSTTQPLPPSLISLSVPSSRQIASTSTHHLLIQAVHTLRESSKVARERKEKKEKEMVKEGLLPPEVLLSSAVKEGTAGDEEGVRRRLDEMGFRVGGDLAERLSFSRPRFVDPLDVVKFICKDVWMAAFDKQVDNLRTNHRGVFVLQDALFPPISHISTHLGHSTDLRLAQIHLAFPQGLLRGALARLGLPATVSAESSGLPQVTFQVKTTKLTLGP